ncbi:hypothetical protein BRADI_4g18352v3 [Brachypodium distachyon]|uniref:Uncharacterized protein n=1 Tax=Brachypodium distachyon TaxID=15368 RepID=A0A0Q3IQE0_BRADI|nr:hypothetical protein BRADI_4g18352v3 [Brachypodium distachyon]
MARFLPLRCSQIHADPDRHGHAIHILYLVAVKFIRVTQLYSSPVD